MKPQPIRAPQIELDSLRLLEQALAEHAKVVVAIRSLAGRLTADYLVKQTLEV